MRRHKSSIASLQGGNNGGELRHKHARLETESAPTKVGHSAAKPLLLSTVAVRPATPVTKGW